MKNKHLLILSLIFMFSITASGQEVLTLQQCRDRAIEANHDLKVSAEKVKEAEALKNMALCQYFPTLNANGAYAYNEKNISLLSQEQQNSINTMGTQAMEAIEPTIGNIAHDLVFTNPLLALNLYHNLKDVDLVGPINDVGESITDAFQLDMHNVFVGAVSVTQPIFMGGRIVETHKATKYAAELSSLQYDKKQEEILSTVDEVYWQVISIQNKLELAQQYCDLLEKLNNDVNTMIVEGVATKSDALKVQVKLNEAQMSLTKANNGLTLCKMLLCQVCGMPLDSNFALADEDIETPFSPMDTLDMEQIWGNRLEIKMLENTEKIAHSGVKIAASTLMPNILASASYVTTNPNLYNGFQNKFGGMFTVGVMVNIPIAEPSRAFAVKAAKYKRNEIQYQIEDAKEKICLQVNKINYELEVANKKLAQSKSNLQHAEENLRMANEAFEAGIVTGSEVMGAQTAWLQAHSEVIDAGIETRMNNLYLQQALGNSK